MATKRLKNWFFSLSLPPARFRNGDKPPRATFEDLLESVPLFLETGSRANQTEQGLIRLATDAEANAADSTLKSPAFQMALQPHHLPQLVGGVESTNFVEEVDSVDRSRTRHTILSNVEYFEFEVDSSGFGSDGAGTFTVEPGSYVRLVKTNGIDGNVVYQYMLALNGPHVFGTVNYFWLDLEALIPGIDILDLPYLSIGSTTDPIAAAQFCHVFAIAGGGGKPVRLEIYNDSRLTPLDVAYYNTTSKLYSTGFFQTP